MHISTAVDTHILCHVHDLGVCLGDDLRQEGVLLLQVLYLEHQQLTLLFLALCM
jgi:hypothetical protein